MSAQGKRPRVLRAVARLKRLLGDLLGRAFQGSSSALVSHLLDHASPNQDELRAIRSAIEEHERGQKGTP